MKSVRFARPEDAENRRRMAIALARGAQQAQIEAQRQMAARGFA